MDPRVERVFRDILDDGNLVVTEDLSPENTPSWDSFAQVKIVIALEEEFRTSFTMDDVAGASTAGDFVKILRDKGLVE